MRFTQSILGSIGLPFLCVVMSIAQANDAVHDDLLIEEGADGKFASLAPDELNLLDFLIGEWELASITTGPDGASQEFPGRMIGKVSMNGFGIELINIHPPYKEEDFQLFIGTRIITFHPEDKKFVGVAINTIGNRKFTEGEFKNNRLYITSSGEMFGDGAFISRTTYFNISPDGFETRLETSADGGETWRSANYATRAKKIKE